MKIDYLPSLAPGALSPPGGSAALDGSSRKVAGAVQALNSAEYLGLERQLVYRRDAKTGSQVIQIVNRGTGDVLDQIPAEVLLRLHAEFERQMKAQPAANDPSLA